MAMDVRSSEYQQHLASGTRTVEAEKLPIFSEILGALGEITERTNSACSSIEMTLSRAGIEWSTAPSSPPSNATKPDTSLGNIENALRFGQDQASRLEALARAINRLA